MPLNAARLRKWFAISAVALLMVVLSFYSYARYRVRRAINDIPQKLGVNIQQSTQGFTFSKSEGGRTLFSITAGKAVQYKDGQHAALSNVRIVVYNRSKDVPDSSGGKDKSDHYDQIFGKEFEYDPNSGDVTGRGEVHIDLDATGKPSPTMDDSQELPGMIHLRTSGLTFNQRTGIAQTDQPIDFAIPQASGSALGARYDAKLLAIVLEKNVVIKTIAPHGSRNRSSLNEATIFAENALISDQPRQAFLAGVRMEQGNRKFAANDVTISLRDDNSISNMLATGNVSSTTSGKSASDIHAGSAAFAFGSGNVLSNLVMSGSVTLHETGASPIEGSAGHVAVDFTGKNEIHKVRATSNVHFIQQTGERGPATQKNAGQATQLTADAVDFFFSPRNQLQRAETSGAAQLEMTSDIAATGQQLKPGRVRTVITSGKFDASFGPQNRIKSLFGSPNAKIVSSTPGTPDRVSISRDFTANFDPARNGGIAQLTQNGDVHYSDGQRIAVADSAQYTPADEMVTLTGAPRVQDKDSGITITAQHIKMNRSGQGVSAEGEVKTTYDSPKHNNPNGALSSQTGDPLHVTADAMKYSKASAVARYSGHSRLWQGADIVQAPVIVFDQKNATITASSDARAITDKQPVNLSFVKADKSGKVTPITATGTRLTYSDKDRVAKLEGPVEIKMPDATLSAKFVDVFLQPKNAASKSQSATPSQVDRIVARQDLVIEQHNPTRKAVGEKLIYTSADEKFVLTGTPEKLPSIFDAEHGNVIGNSLTFYNRDDRVQVGGSDSSRTVTRTRVKNESKP